MENPDSERKQKVRQIFECGYKVVTIVKVVILFL